MKEKSEIKARYDRAANAMNYVVGLLCIAGVLLGGYLEQYIGVFLTLGGAVGAAVSGYASLLYRKVPKEADREAQGLPGRDLQRQSLCGPYLFRDRDRGGSDRAGRGLRMGSHVSVSHGGRPHLIRKKKRRTGFSGAALSCK